MTAYRVLFIGGLVLAIIFLIATIALFFLLKIPQVMGVLTGNAEKRALEELNNKAKATAAKKQTAAKITAHEASVEESKRSTKTASKAEEQNEEPEKTANANSFSREAAEEHQSGIGAGKPTGTRAGRDYSKTHEDTEVLGADELMNGGDGTEVLTAGMQEDGDEEGTDVLIGGKNSSAFDRIRAAKSYDSANRDNLGYDLGDDEDEATTDVLRGENTAPYYEGNSRVDASDDQEAETSVLTGNIESAEDAMASNAEDETSVLTSVDETGVYYKEETASGSVEDVASMMEMNASTGKSQTQPKAVAEKKPGIKVIYSKTIVHTDETL